MSVVGIYRTLQQFGPFELGVPTTALLVVQFLVSIVSMLLLAVAAETHVRRRVESELRLLNETLERRVSERTAALTGMTDRLVEAQAVAQIGSWEWDVAKNELWWSDEMCRIFGVPSAPAGYEPYLLLLHPDDRDWTDAAVRQAITTGKPFTFEHRLIRPDGETRVIHARGRAEFDGSGALQRLLGTGHDITERLQAEAARTQLIQEQAKLREAEETNRAKDAFLATLSHELRTPLNAALGWTHILRDSIQAEGRDDRVIQAIYRNLKLQARIVSDILDISRIAKGELPMDRERVEVRAVFEVAADMVREAALARGVTIDILGATPAVVGDNRRLQQVAWNLLSNAVKFAAAQGRVIVSIQETPEIVECSVEDDGPGIAPAFLPHVFEQFRQADSSTTREHGGLGLGLAIANEIVAMHNGTIVADNRPEGGAVFVVRLPNGNGAGRQASFQT
jgi:PAS domain S-box-containing protein